MKNKKKTGQFGVMRELAFLAVMSLSSSAGARTDLTEDYTNLPPTHSYKQQERYVARTECEVYNYTSSPSVAQQVPALPPKLSLLERLNEALKNECGKARLDKNEIVCEDTVRCTQQETTGKEYDDPNSICVEYYCPTSTTSCVQWQMKERWRMNPYIMGTVEALLIDTQKIEDLQQPLSFSYALRPVGKNELYLFKMESTTRQIRNLINHEKK